METGFNAGQFLWGTFIFAVVPTAFIVLLIFATFQGLKEIRATYKSATSPTKGSPKRFIRVSGMALAFLAGIAAGLLWLTWDGSSGPISFFKHGMSNQFMAWQVVCCGITIIVLSGLVVAKFVHFADVLMTVTVFSAAGFTTFFCFGVSYGLTSQEGVGVLLSYVGMNLMLLLTNGIVLAAMRARSAGQSRHA